MSFLTVANVEALSSNVDFLHLEFGAVRPIVSCLSSVPAQDISYWQWGSATRVLHKCQPIVVRVLDALLPCWHLVVIQKTNCFNNGLWEDVLSLCHIICKISLQLIESGVDRSLQAHAQQVGVATHRQCLLQFGSIGHVDICRQHSFLQQLGLDYPRLVPICTSIGLNYAHQCLEVFHVFCDRNFVALIVCQTVVLCTF